MPDKPYTFKLYDYSEVELSNDELKKLKLLFGESDEFNESDELNESEKFKIKKAFCECIQEYVYDQHNKNSGVLVMGEKDKAEKPKLFTIMDNCIRVNGYCGVISFMINDEEVTVHFDSRFNRNNSYFLLHLFEVSFDIMGNVYTDISVPAEKERTWDYMIMLMFLKQCHDAFKGGIYREYREFEYNDSNVKGRIDISRHIKENMLNNGKIAYSTIEYTPDNYINILILKAYERLLRVFRRAMTNYVSGNDVVEKGINSLMTEIPNLLDYSDGEILKKTNRKIVKNVYKKYEPLRETAIFILKRYGINGLSQKNRRSNGILISIPHLWEQYLYKKVFSVMEGTDGEKYHQESYPILFEEEDGKPGRSSKREVKPDFLVKSNYVFDAKYKVYWSNTLTDDTWTKTREDVFQTISYMHLFDCKYGGIVFPYDKDSNETESVRVFSVGGEGKLREEKFILVPIMIPQGEQISWTEFKRQMQVKLDEKVKDLNEIMGLK